MIYDYSHSVEHNGFIFMELDCKIEASCVEPESITVDRIWVENLTRDPATSGDIDLIGSDDAVLAALGAEIKEAAEIDVEFIAEVAGYEGFVFHGHSNDPDSYYTRRGSRHYA